MKKLLLVAVMLASTVTMARGSDNDYRCNVAGTKGNGQRISYWGPTMMGPEFRVRTFTLRYCRAKGLSDCRIQYCRDTPY